MLKKFLLIFAVTLLFSSCSPSREATGHMVLRVLDGMTDLPVCGAEVLVPETGERYLTDESGRTEPIKLPVKGDSEYDRLLENPEGRITFIVRAEGYTTYLLLYARVTKEHTRTADILLFTDDGTMPVFTVIEAPSEQWTRELVEKYR